MTGSAASALQGRTALVTGGARGLGRAIAETFARHGTAIHVLDREDVLAEAALPSGWGAIPLDLGAADAEKQLAEAISQLDSLDILVANAGIVPPWRRVAALDVEEWDRVFAVNVRGVALCLKHAAPRLAEAEDGCAIVMASINAYKAHPDQTLYTASKHAVLGLARAAALDLGRDGVRVNALAPGPILTDALRGRIANRAASGGPSEEAVIDEMAAQTALGRMATPDDVSAAALYLAQARAVTGVCLPVEAGLA